MSELRTYADNTPMYGQAAVDTLGGIMAEPLVNAQNPAADPN